MSGQPDQAIPDDRGTPEGMQVTDSSAPPESAGPPASHQPPPRAGRPTRRWLHWLRIAAIVVILPVIALLIGLLIAWIVHLIRGNPAPHRAVVVIPPVASVAPTTAAPKKPAPVVVPSDWVVEDVPPVGLTFSHPPDWVRRTSTPEVLRFAPATPGSTAPGIEGVGAGIETAANPAQAVTDFATRVYGTQPGYVSTPVAPVAATTSGAHPGEQAAVITYLRSGVQVRVVIHSYRSGTQTVLAMGRSANAQAARAAQLEAFVEASIKVG